MNDAARIFTPPGDPCALDQVEGWPRAEAQLTAVKAALIAYAEAREAGPIPTLSLNERRRQAMRGLEHVSALDAERGAAFISIHHRVEFADGRLPTFPGNAHQNLDTALKDAFYWANSGHDVYWGMGGQARRASITTAGRIQKRSGRGGTPPPAGVSTWTPT
jgi:hypothetical protein